MKDDFTAIKTIFENAPVGIFLSDLSGKMVNLNQRLAEIFGYESLEDFQKHVKNLATDLYADAGQREKIISEIEKDTYHSYRIRMKKKDGSFIPVRLYLKPYKSTDSNKDYFIGTVEDLSQQQSLEDQLDSMKFKYKSIFDNSGEAVFIQKNSYFIDFNTRARELFELYDPNKQYSLADISPKNQPDGQLSLEKANNHIKAVLNGEVQRFEYACITQNGKPVYTEVTLSKLNIEVQDCFIAIVRDITRQKEMEQSLHESEVRYHQLFNNAPMGIVRTNTNGDVLLVNNKLIQSLGYESQKDFIAEKHNIIEFYADKSKREWFLQEIHKHNELDFELDIKTRDSRIIKAHCIAKAEKDGNNTIKYITGYIDDITEKLETLHQLKQREAMLNSVVNCIPFVLTVNNMNNIILLQNKGSQQRLGEHIGDHISAMSLSAESIKIWEDDVKQIKKKHTRDYEFKMEHKGKTYYIRRIVAPLLINDEVEGCISLSIDITDRVLLENKTKQNENILRSIINCLPFELVVADREHNVLIQNDYSRRIIGDLEGKNFFIIPLPEEIKQEWQNRVKKVFENKTLNFEDAVPVDDKTFYYKRILSPFIEDEKIKGTVALSIDITDRVLLENKTKHSESVLRSIIASLPYEVWVIDKNYKVLIQSNYSIKKWGSYIGKSTSEFVTIDEDRGLWNEQLIKVLNGEQIDTEACINYKDKLIYSRRIIAPLYIDNAIEGLIVISIDITPLKTLQLELEKHRDNLEMLVKERTEEIGQLNEELVTSNEELYSTNEMLTEQRNQLQDLVEELKQTQNQLVQSEKMASLGTLISGIAHEINNPVNFISGGITGLEFIIDDMINMIQASLQLSNNTDESRARKNLVISDIPEKITEISKEVPAILQSIRNGIERTTAIIKGLRTFSRLDTENKVLSNIHEIINSALTILHNKYKNHIEIEKKFTEIEEILCYPGKLGQVFLNIINNAIQAIPEKGKIIIKSDYDKNKSNVVISIKDNGQGMSKEVMNRIFDPFFTTKDVNEGTGLGLSIAHGIIEEHSGSIQVFSEPEEGTEFIINLPVIRNT